MANSQHERSELDPAVRHGGSIVSLVDEPRLETAPPGAVWFTVCTSMRPSCFDQDMADATRDQAARARDVMRSPR